MTNSQAPRSQYQPGREPIPEGAWSELVSALRRWADALQDRWRDPAFRVRRSSLSARDQLLVTTTANPDAAKTPKVQHPIRGASGVSVTVSYNDDTQRNPRLFDAIWESPFRWLSARGPSQSERAVESARDGIGAIVDKYSELRRAMMRVSWGPVGAETSDAREGGQFPDRGSVELAIAHLFERVLTKSGVRIDDLSSASMGDNLINETVDRLRQSVEAKAHQCEIVALLNCPAVDTNDSVTIWEGTWNEASCAIEIGYPDDALCAAVLEDLGYRHIQRESNLDHINCYIRFKYSIPADLPSDAWENTNWRAEAYVHDIVDLIRVAFDGDVGVLHLAGRSSSQDELLLNPPFWNVFQERPGYVPRTPLRRIYDPPPTRAIAEEALGVIGHMFQRFAIERIQVPGLPVAMDRLRAIFERYEPGELGRLVDAVTGLEALFLSEVATDELKYRLQIRIARFLETDLQKRVLLAKEFAKLYALRSKMVHTGLPGSVKEDDADALQRRAIVLLRRALVTFILTDFAVGKDANGMADIWLEFMLKNGVHSAE